LAVHQVKLEVDSSDSLKHLPQVVKLFLEDLDFLKIFMFME
jgi:hypothetical protein